jgi:PBSX family phage terminase large subunit
MRFPGSYGIVTRWSYRELEATSFKDLLSIIPPSFIESHNKSQMLIRLKNGSVIQGFNLQNHKRLTSLNISWAWIDEVTEVDESNFLQLQGRLRGVAPRRMWVTGNPNGRDWVYETFVNQARPEYAFFHAKTYENTFLPNDYIDNMRKYLPAEWVDRFVEGSFEVFEGQIYHEFSAAVHVISHNDVFPIPPEWPRFRAIDHGIYHPTACLWGAADPDGNLFIYDQYYQRNRLISENCAEIVKKSGNDIFDWSVIDPNTDRRDATTGTSYMDEYRKNGVQVVKGQNAILDGISRVKELLYVDENHRHPLTMRPHAPRLYIFPDCDKLIWEIQQYRWRDQPTGAMTRDKEEPVDRHNHAIDALRYMAMQNPQSRDKSQGIGEWDRWRELLDDLSGTDKAEDDDLTIGRWLVRD